MPPPVTFRNSRIVRRCISAYISNSRRLWTHLPVGLRRLAPGQVYGRHLHAFICGHARRGQSFGTFFLRNRPELELLRRLLDSKAADSTASVTILACSKGAEVYSFLKTIRSARPDLKLKVNALDISQEILDFAEKGIYSLDRQETLDPTTEPLADLSAGVMWNTQRDQIASIFHRMTDGEVETMFQLEDHQARIKPWLREGITWFRGDACDPELVATLGLQDIVVANRFLCHMQPSAAETCLRNVARLVKSGGYLFVTGVDLDVRTRVASALGWIPVTDLIREIHDGDPSLRNGWPLEYWGLEPFCDSRPDWRLRYASVFQVGERIPGAPRSEEKPALRASTE
jgi:chemotaxis methyl-accepting protein methylase